MIQNHEFQSSIGEEILGLWGRHVVEVLAVARPRAHAHMLRGVDEVLSVNVCLVWSIRAISISRGWEGVTYSLARFRLMNDLNH